MSANPALAALLEHPAIWRGRSCARCDGVPTGFPALDAHLPGGGWPRVGLIEVLIPRLGVGELLLLLPALKALGESPTARWCAWIAPPFELFAPALAAHGMSLERSLIVHTEAPLWACEQALGSGACDVALAWVRRAPPRALRRLQLATERGRTLGILFRTLGPRALREPSCAVLRVAVQPASEGVRLKLLKSRGGPRSPLTVSFQSLPK